MLFETILRLGMLKCSSQVDDYESTIYRFHHVEPLYFCLENHASMIFVRLIRCYWPKYSE